MRGIVNLSESEQRRDARSEVQMGLWGVGAVFIASLRKSLRRWSSVLHRVSLCKAPWSWAWPNRWKRGAHFGRRARDKASGLWCETLGACQSSEHTFLTGL